MRRATSSSIRSAMSSRTPVRGVPVRAGGATLASLKGHLLGSHPRLLLGGHSAGAVFMSPTFYSCSAPNATEFRLFKPISDRSKPLVQVTPPARNRAASRLRYPVQLLAYGGQLVQLPIRQLLVVRHLPFFRYDRGPSVVRSAVVSASPVRAHLPSSSGRAAATPAIKAAEYSRQACCLSIRQSVLIAPPSSPSSQCSSALSSRSSPRPYLPLSTERGCYAAGYATIQVPRCTRGASGGHARSS